MNTLTDTTMLSLQASFVAHSNYPSPEHLAALRAVAQNMEDMVNGTAGPCVYLAALDPGVGKTQTTIHFIRALVASEAHCGVGMVVCLARISQIEAIAKELNLPKGTLAVLTSDIRLNAALSTAPVDQAQILLTTQQSIERRTQGGSFGTTQALLFRGVPRAVRVWDEALEWAAPTALSWTRIAMVPDSIKTYSPDLSKALVEFATRLTSLRHGDEVQVPDFEAAHGIQWEDLEAALADGADGGAKVMSAVRDLKVLNGRLARAFVENSGSGAVLAYKQRVPDDIRPLLVLDASIRVRQIYRDMETHREGFVRLAAAVKDYSDLKVHVWKHAGSKDAFFKGTPKIVEGVAKTILTKPNEHWLVVTHKSGSRVKDIEEMVRALLPPEVSLNVFFLTFGNHMATNDYSEVPNVILAGQFFEPNSLYAARTHAAQGRSLTTGLVATTEVEATRRGELADVTLQAIARGSCRKSAGSKAFPMDAYIMATSQSGIPALLPTIFPGCAVKVWEPFPKPLKGNLLLAIEYVKTALGEGRTTIAYKDISKDLGIMKGNFSTHVTQKEEWVKAVTELGLTILKATRGVFLVRDETLKAL